MGCVMRVMGYVVCIGCCVVCDVDGVVWNVLVWCMPYVACCMSCVVGCMVFGVC